MNDKNKEQKTDAQNQSINPSANKKEQQETTNINQENNAAKNSNTDEDPNPVYTNGEAPQQQIERDTQGVMAKGTKDDPSAIYSTHDSTLQSKEEKQHDEKIDPQKNDDIEANDMSHTKADDRFLRRGENLNKE